MSTTRTQQRTAIRLPDGALLAVPYMHPNLPSAERQAIFTAVLRRDPGLAYDLAERAEKRRQAGAAQDLAVTPDEGRAESIGSALTESPDVTDSREPERVKGPKADTARPVRPGIPMVQFMTARGVIEVPAAAVPRWGMVFPRSMTQPRPVRMRDLSGAVAVEEEDGQMPLVLDEAA